MLTKTTILKSVGAFSLNKVEIIGVRTFYSVTEIVEKGEGRGLYTVIKTHKETNHLDIATSRFETALIIGGLNHE